jgi:hypothetical protein
VFRCHHNVVGASANEASTQRNPWATKVARLRPTGEGKDMGRFRPAVAAVALIACSLSASGLASAVEQAGEPPLAKNQATVTYVRWANFNSDKCLGIPNGNMTNGTGAIQWTCSGALDQYWEFRKVSGLQVYEFRNRVNPNKCLAVPGALRSEELSWLSGLARTIVTNIGSSPSGWTYLGIVCTVIRT